ncbi:alpha-L-fucosidase, partial [Planctomycetota bacterium]
NKTARSPILQFCAGVQDRSTGHLVLEELSMQKRTISKPYKSTWESVTQHPNPNWFQDAKFGIYFHWGPYSVPAFQNEWYSHWMYQPGHPINKHHVDTYGPLDQFGYKDFIPMFTAEKFDPDAWVSLFKKAGARFVGPVTEHADGFAMWDSALTEWNAAKMGPKRDIVGEMEKAVRQEGLKFITTLHHQWLYAWYPTLDANTDASLPAYRDLYGPPLPRSAFEMAEDKPSVLADAAFNQRWLSRATEVVDKYEPDLVYFDNKLNILADRTLTDFLSHYYNRAQAWGRDVVTTYKFEEFQVGAGMLDLERSRMRDSQPFPWLTDDSIDWESWCHVQDPNYKSTHRLITFLIDVVSKNGCVLLNVTPTAEGEIPEPVQQRLLDMGKWLALNGEAIYDTRPWKIYGEGNQEIVEGHLSERQNRDATSEEIRFTQRDNLLYAVILDWPEDHRVRIKSLPAGSVFVDAIESIHLLGHDLPLSWSRDSNGLHAQLPVQRPCDYAYVLKIKLDMNQ